MLENNVKKLQSKLFFVKSIHFGEICFKNQFDRKNDKFSGNKKLINKQDLKNSKIQLHQMTSLTNFPKSLNENQNRGVRKCQR